MFGIILLNRFKGEREERTRGNQARFRPGKIYTDNIFAFLLIIQQFERYNLPLILMFLDFIAAFDSVTRQKLWKILENDGMPGMPLKFVELMKACYDASASRVRVYGAQIEQNLLLTELDYPDDVGLLSDPVKAQNMLDGVVAWADLIGMKVSTEKTKFMAINHDTGPFPLIVNRV
ncbi:uncharacterized protein LOC136033530 [Artemia franciscana]|uniref:uncharacterized protein LOC136033530 n=1 Tax=Artemia franciscana TaxID=6661 RepID=UPI0032DAE1CE